MITLDMIFFIAGIRLLCSNVGHSSSHPVPRLCPRGCIAPPKDTELLSVLFG